MVSHNAADPYIDPETGTLRNLVGARTPAELAGAEGDLVFARMVQLAEHPPEPTGDLAELQAIHRQLFQDVYAWAGELRLVELRKNVEDAEPFLPFSMILRASTHVVEALASDDLLRSLPRGRFVERLAFHYDQLNYIHPFREGNGRTQRVFWTRVARDAGWTLDWRLVSGAANDSACRAASEDRDLAPLRRMFDLMVAQASARPPGRGAPAETERLRATFRRVPGSDGEARRHW
ncbi:Fic/DOC family protein [Rothia halotolerans]|uniref:Fic/DOC family protein n=1 Tax=Rothia halotolerans TaxID=405770 RepID=UPI00101D4686|nr:Fic family protein [Rothia halotolerans]